MIKKILLCFCIILFVACGSSKPVITTSKPVTRIVKKPVSKPVVKTESNTTKVESAQQTEILEATTRVKVTTELVMNYIDKYKTIAKQDMLSYGIPASITLGQGILESGAGTGPLSEQANNHFGIKCHLEWNGPSVKYDDDSEQECFRKYANPEESYRDHSMFLTSRSRYSSLFKLSKNDYKSWAKGLKAAGYATDPNYPAKLISLIERYNLQKYDAEVLGSSVIETRGNGVGNSASSNFKTHQVVKGDTLYSLSKKYNISIEELKKINNISDNGISIGQNLILN